MLSCMRRHTDGAVLAAVLAAFDSAGSKCGAAGRQDLLQRYRAHVAAMDEHDRGDLT